MPRKGRGACSIPDVFLLPLCVSPWAAHNCNGCASSTCQSKKGVISATMTEFSANARIISACSVRQGESRPPPLSGGLQHAVAGHFQRGKVGLFQDGDGFRAPPRPHPRRRHRPQALRVAFGQSVTGLAAYFDDQSVDFLWPFRARASGPGPAAGGVPSSLVPSSCRSPCLCFEVAGTAKFVNGAPPSPKNDHPSA